jgi:hypothetical protein
MKRATANQKISDRAITETDLNAVAVALTGRRLPSIRFDSEARPTTENS